MNKKNKFSNIRAASKNRLPVLAIDADGTLLFPAKPPLIKPPIPGVIDELNKLRLAGWIICIWTCRSDVFQLKNHLDSFNVPYDYINENPLVKFDHSNKMVADVYLDDKGINFDGNTDGLADKILHFTPWHEE